LEENLKNFPFHHLNLVLNLASAFLVHYLVGVASQVVADGFREETEAEEL
jgi:hypothetical protein